MKTHLVLVGFGQNRSHLIPGLMSISNKFPQLKVTIIDKRDFHSIIRKDDDYSLTEDQIRWSKKHFVQEQDDDDQYIVQDLCLEEISKNNNLNLRRIFYLSIPPDAVEHVIKKYSKYADIFVIEKPWALDQLHLQKITKYANLARKKIFGVDHYLWKPEVRQFLRYMQLESNQRLLRKNDNFDFVLCEPELDPPDRTYFWKTGIAMDMIPHVLPMLDRLFGNNCTISLKRAIPAICNDIVVRDILDNNRDKVSGDNRIKSDKYTVKETFAEIALSVSVNSHKRKLVHVLLGKGARVKPIFVCNETRKAQKFFYSSLGKIFLDLDYQHIMLKCKKKVSNSREDPWYYIFKALVSGKDYDLFVHVEYMEKYVSLYTHILRKFNDSVKYIAGQEYTSGYAGLLLNSDQLRYIKGEIPPLQLIHPNCCFNNNSNNDNDNG